MIGFKGVHRKKFVGPSSQIHTKLCDGDVMNLHPNPERKEDAIFLGAEDWDRLYSTVDVVHAISMVHRIQIRAEISTTIILIQTKNRVQR